MNCAEGNSEEVETQGGQPGVLTCSPPPGSETGARTQGLTRNLGRACGLRQPRNGEAKREASDVGVTSSRSAA